MTPSISSRRGSSSQANQSAAEGTYYIYGWHQGVLQYVGALIDPEDVADNLGQNYVFAAKTARVSADGRILVFSSASGEGLSGYQHAGGCGLKASDPNPGPEPCKEVYVFDAAADNGHGLLSCASCLPGGAQPGVSASSVFRGAGISTSGPTSHQGNFLSANGRFVFFSTGSPLVPADKNGNVIDVYEYDTLTRQVHLISSGRGSSDSLFQDASADGSNVFFTTRDRLVGWDSDQNLDLYDARIDGGVPEPPLSVGECSGDACQGSASTPAAQAGSASSLLSGAGNLPAPPASKPPAKALSRAQKLTQALRSCRTKPKRQRKKCESQARRKYGPPHTAKKSDRRVK